MINIDRETPNLVCIQIPLNDRQAFTVTLKGLLKSGGTVALEANEGVVRFSLSESGFIADASSENEVIITLPYDECVELIEAVQEHIEEETEYPLDHSLESAGAKMIPDTLEDVVIETVQ